MESLSKAIAAAEAALEKKAYDLVVLEVRASLVDRGLFFDRDRALRRAGPGDRARNRGADASKSAIRPLSIEGVNHAHWIVLDYDDLVVHIFFEPAREFYRLERTWADATAVALPEPIRTQANELRLRAQA